MGTKTKIEWADSTASPWYGCRKVSPGCANCYAEGWAIRAGKDIWGKGKPRQKSVSFERDCRRLNTEAVKYPLRCPRCYARFCDGDLLGTPYVCPDCQPHQTVTLEQHRPGVFPSLCDWLDPEVPAEWLADALRVMHECANLNYLLLTKRPDLFDQRISEADRALPRDSGVQAAVRQWAFDGQPPDNIWVGTSCEDQQRADERIPHLLRIPAKVRFLSLEPLLGPIDLKLVRVQDRTFQTVEPISLVIVGGESGHNARPCNVEWIRGIVHQCKNAGVPCFVKQLGSNPHPSGSNNIGRQMTLNHPKGGDPAEWPEDLRVREMP